MFPTATLFHPIFLLFLSLFVFLLKWLLSPQTNNKQNLPPSPPKLPIIGNLHQLGPQPHRSLQTLARRHGPLILLHLGNIPTLIVSSAEFARAVMKTHDLFFSNRPNSAIPRRLLYDLKDLSLAPYGDYWRQMRSICVLQLLNTKRVHSFRRVREEETIALLEKIENRSSSPMDLSEMLASLTNDVISRVAFGRKYSEGERGKKFKELLEEFGALLGVFNVGDFIPWLGWVNYVSGLNGRVERNFREFDCFLDEVIDDHMGQWRSGRKKGGGKGEDEQMDLVDVLLEIQKDSSSSMDGGASLGRDNLKAIILDMFAAGADTTYTVLEWTMTELLRHPIIMKKLQEEVRGIAPKKANLSEDDLEQMHYLKAIIKETLRLHPPVPLLIPRESTKHVKLQGYDIPTKTRVFINAWAIGRDPLSWEEPEEFRPERFLNSFIDFNGQNFQFIPFGAGRRGCPGIVFAIANLELVLASLVHKFDWALPGGVTGDNMDLAESSGITIHRKFPLILVATPCF
ncbi:hypothetical protein ACSBR2_011715 [Camellia fascicularis]